MEVWQQQLVDEYARMVAKIDQLEISRGLSVDKPREKFTRVNEILQLLK